MNISETIKTELQGLCRRIAELLHLKQGSIEIHCHRGKATQLHYHDGPEDLGDGLGIIKHDKSIKFDENK